MNRYFPRPPEFTHTALEYFRNILCPAPSFDTSHPPVAPPCDVPPLWPKNRGVRCNKGGLGGFHWNRSQNVCFFLWFAGFLYKRNVSVDGYWSVSGFPPSEIFASQMDWSRSYIEGEGVISIEFLMPMAHIFEDGTWIVYFFLVLPWLEPKQWFR